MTNQSTMNNCISAKRKKNERACFHRSRTTMLSMFAFAFTLLPRVYAHTGRETLLQRGQQRSGQNANNNLVFVNNGDIDCDYIEYEDSSILDNPQRRQRAKKKSKQQGGVDHGISASSKKSKASRSKAKSNLKLSTKSASGKKSKGGNVFDRGSTPYPTSGGPPRGQPSVSGSDDTPNMPPGQSPQPTPNVNPTPPPLGFPTLPTRPPPTPSLPTPPPTPPPTIPTASTPTRATPRPTPRPTIPSGTTTIAPVPPVREPTSSAPVSPTSPTDPRCSVGSSGLFGSQLGLAEETVYYMEAIVTPTVMADELNIDILGRVENLMAGIILERLFDRCAPETTVRSIFLTKGHLRRILQDGQTIEGFSLRPRDVVLDGVECVSTVPTGSDLSCFVIEGKVTTYTAGRISEETKRDVRAAIRNAVETGRLARADNRLLAVNYRDIDRNPIPTDPTAAPVGEPPLVRSTGGDDDGGLQNWAIALIAGGGAIACLFAFLCLRRSSHSALEDDDSSSSSSSSASAKPTKEETEALTNNEPFVAPMPLFRPPINEDPPESEYESKNKEWNVQSTPGVDRTFGDEEHKEADDEEESSEEESSKSESGSEVEEESRRSESAASEESLSQSQEDQFAAMAANAKPQSTNTAFSQPDFDGPESSYDDRKDSFGRPASDSFGKPASNSFGKPASDSFGKPASDNMFGAESSAPSPGLARSQGTNSSESEYSSYEEVEEEYEIEYVEDEGNLESLEEASDEDEDELESWYDDPGEGKVTRTSALPW